MDPFARPARFGGRLSRLRAGGGTFAALSERDFAWYFAGNMAFFTGTQMNIVLRGFLAFDLTNAATALGLISVSVALPMLLVAPLGGVVADRVDKRLLLISTQVLIAISNLVIAVLILMDLVVFWHLLITAVVSASAMAVNMPARQAMVPQLVPRHKLMNAVSLQMGGQNLTRILGPAVGGVLIAPLGTGLVYLIPVVLMGVAIVAELALPRHGMVAQEKPRRFMEDLKEGFRYIWAQPVIRLLILTALALPLFAFPVQQILPVFADAVFDRGPSALGLLMGATGVGGLIGALIAANLDRVPRKGRVMAVGGLVMGVFFIAFAVTPLFWPALIFLALGSVGRMLFMTTNNTVIQAIVPGEFRGRVMSVLMMSFGLMPLGVLPVTAAADAVGAPAAIAGSAVVLIAVVVLVFGLSAQIRRLNLSALEEAEFSPVQAARLVAEGKLSQVDADRLVRTTARAGDLAYAGAAPAFARTAPGEAGPTPLKATLGQ